jgi:hypothetical protein
MITLRRRWQQFYRRGGLREDFVATIKYEMIMSSNFSEGDAEWYSVAFGMPATVLEPCEADLFVSPSRLTPFT